MEHNHPLGKNQKNATQVDHSWSTDIPAIARELQEIDSDDDNYGEDEWNPHAGTKPSPLDGDASDDERDPDSEVEGFRSEVFNDQMVKMISDLQDNDLRDQEWKQKSSQKKNSGQFRTTH